MITPEMCVRFRRRLCISQAALAKIAGISREGLTKFEAHEYDGRNSKIPHKLQVAFVRFADFAKVVSADLSVAIDGDPLSRSYAEEAVDALYIRVCELNTTALSVEGEVELLTAQVKRLSHRLKGTERPSNIDWHATAKQLPDDEVRVLFAAGDEVEVGHHEGDSWITTEEHRFDDSDVYAWAHLPAAPDLPPGGAS